MLTVLYKQMWYKMGFKDTATVLSSDMLGLKVQRTAPQQLQHRKFCQSFPLCKQH